MLWYAFLFMGFVVLLTGEWKIVADTATWSGVEISTRSKLLFLFYLEVALACLIGCCLFDNTFLYPSKSYTILSHFMLSIQVALLFSFVWMLFRKKLTWKTVQIFAIFSIVSLLAFVADQDTLSRVEIDVSTSKAVPFTDELYLLPTDNLDEAKVSTLEKIPWKFFYYSNNKPVLCSKDYRNIAIIDQDMVFGYLNIVPEVPSTPLNTLPAKLTFRNLVNLGLTVDEENIPYFKYALLTKESLSGNYLIESYALCNVLTHEVDFFKELPDWAI